MGHPQFSREEIARRGQEVYDREIRAEVEGRFDGKIVVIDIETGDYELDTSGLAASDRILSRHPGAALFGLRVGFPVVESFGGGLQPVKR